MSLIEEIDDEIKDAMKARDAERRDALRLILDALKKSEKELQRPLSEEEELQVMQRERKRRLEAAEAFRAGGREEQAEAEERELDILEEFMPEPLSEDEIDEIVDDVIAEVGATSDGRPRPRDGRRHAADRRPRGRLASEPDRPREARLACSSQVLRTCELFAELRRGRARSPAALCRKALWRSSCGTVRSWRGRSRA